jgi:hypothetical protein
MRARPVVQAGSRSIEAAALVGIGHAVLAGAAGWLFRRAPTPHSSGAAAWYVDASNQRSIILAVNLMTIGGIAFIWFVAVLRRRVGDRENRFFGTVFYGSGLLVVASWLVGAMLFSVPALSAYLYGVAPHDADIASFRAAAVVTTSMIATRLEAVFIISTTTVLRLSGSFPRWVIILGYTVGAVLLLVPLPNELLTLVFPAWVVVRCLGMLVKRQHLNDLSADA